MDWLVRDVCEVRSEAIIRAVEQLPCLWNLECESYRNKSKRRQGWSAVSRMLIHDFENKNLSERQKIGSFRVFVLFANKTLAIYL